jgi:hypothetical protein
VVVHIRITIKGRVHPSAYWRLSSVDMGRFVVHRLNTRITI